MSPGGLGQLGLIKDPATRQLFQQLADQLSDMQRQIGVLQANALQRGSPVNVAAILQNVSDPENLTDGVNVRTMQRFVASQLARSVTPPVPAPPGVPGTPNTIPSDALPLFDGSAIVQGVFAANPGFVGTSCQTGPGGTWDLMDAIVDALRAADPRFAYNGKRGNVNDPSNDAISYDYAAVPGGEGSTTVYIVDVISGHCGPNPGPAWNDVTVFAPGAWISRGRF